MRKYRIVHTRPYLPRNYGKPVKRAWKKHDFGAIGEALFIIVLIAAFLYACFVGIPL